MKKNAATKKVRLKLLSGQIVINRFHNLHLLIGVQVAVLFDRKERLGGNTDRVRMNIESSSNRLFASVVGENQAFSIGFTAAAYLLLGHQTGPVLLGLNMRPR